MLFADLSDDEFIKIAELNVEIMNHALRDVPAEKVRVHACWGNYEGPHVLDIPMDKVFKTLMSIDAQSVGATCPSKMPTRAMRMNGPFLRTSRDLSTTKCWLRWGHRYDHKLC